MHTFDDISDFYGPRGLFSKDAWTIGLEKRVVKLQSACFEKLICSHGLNVRKTNSIAKFDCLEPRCCEDVKGIVAPEKFGDF